MKQVLCSIVLLVISFCIANPTLGGYKERQSYQNTVVFAGSYNDVQVIKAFIKPQCQYMRSVHISTDAGVVDVWGPVAESGRENYQRFKIPVATYGSDGELSERNAKKINKLTESCIASDPFDVSFHQNTDVITDLSLDEFIPAEKDDYIIRNIVSFFLKGDNVSLSGSIIGEGVDVIHATDTFAVRYHITAKGRVLKWTFQDGDIARVAFHEKWEGKEFAYQAMKFSDLIFRDREDMGLIFPNSKLGNVWIVRTR